MDNAKLISTRISDNEPRTVLTARERRNGHKPGILWITGLSGSGKTTLARALERCLLEEHYQVALVDGDSLRRGLCVDLGFSPEERRENIRRASEVTALLAGAGMIVIAAFISPYRADRDCIRSAHPHLFHEIYLDAPLEICEARDPKGLYCKARLGLSPEFTGVSAPYEVPENPDLVVHTGTDTVENSVACIARYAKQKFSLPTLTVAQRR